MTIDASEGPAVGSAPLAGAEPIEGSGPVREALDGCGPESPLLRLSTTVSALSSDRGGIAFLPTLSLRLDDYGVTVTLGVHGDEGQRTWSCGFGPKGAVGGSRQRRHGAEWLEHVFDDLLGEGVVERRVLEEEAVPDRAV